MCFQGKIKLYPSLLLAAILMIPACGEDPPAEPAVAVADLVLLNGGIYTVDAEVLFTLLDGVAVYTARNQENASE